MSLLENRRTAYPDFCSLVGLISGQNPLQRKQLAGFLAGQPGEYWEDAERVCGTICRSLLRSERERSDAAASYNRMTMDFLREQIRFGKTGIYAADNAVAADREVYSKPEVMRYYMVGLFLSYFLWPNHLEILRFFRHALAAVPAPGAYLEVAPGHGLFAIEALRRFPAMIATLVDISATSISVTGEFLDAFGIGRSGMGFINRDFLDAGLDGKFGLISMGEVLEHVDDPGRFLAKAAGLLADDGYLFMSTCANCPAIDHVYNFRDEEHIRALVRDAGLAVADEKVLPVSIIAQSAGRPAVRAFNYCCMLRKG